ncbi:hypothetical protein AJ88_40865 [Mesorhizobium amorphae CCBAU 01583]|nr:hypothetical protein AJ88_40865 [Mesorhizobium amorphae CCBAU 01583]
MLRLRGTSSGLITGVLPSFGAGWAMPWSPVGGGCSTPPQGSSLPVRPPLPPLVVDGFWPSF